MKEKSLRIVDVYQMIVSVSVTDAMYVPNLVSFSCYILFSPGNKSTWKFLNLIVKIYFFFHAGTLQYVKSNYVRTSVCKEYVLQYVNSMYFSM